MVFYFLADEFVSGLNRIHIKGRNPNTWTSYYEK